RRRPAAQLALERCGGPGRGEASVRGGDLRGDERGHAVRPALRPGSRGGSAAGRLGPDHAESVRGRYSLGGCRPRAYPRSGAEGDIVLGQLLRFHLKPYAGAVALSVVLQVVQVVATLLLPSLNADIIDRGVARGDTGEILRVGGVMLAVSLVQVIAAIAAVYFGSKAAMG